MAGDVAVGTAVEVVLTAHHVVPGVGLVDVGELAGGFVDPLLEEHDVPVLGVERVSGLEVGLGDGAADARQAAGGVAGVGVPDHGDEARAVGAVVVVAVRVGGGGALVVRDVAASQFAARFMTSLRAICPPLVDGVGVGGVGGR